MPVTVVFFWWQARILQKYRQSAPLVGCGGVPVIGDVNRESTGGCHGKLPEIAKRQPSRRSGDENQIVMIASAPSLLVSRYSAISLAVVRCLLRKRIGARRYRKKPKSNSRMITEIGTPSSHKRIGIGLSHSPMMTLT